MVSSSSLCGFPYLTGFYSKDIILEFFFMDVLGVFVFFVFIISIFLTFVYSIRLLVMLGYLGGIYCPNIFLMDCKELLYPISSLFMLSVLGGGAMI